MARKSALITLSAFMAIILIMMNLQTTPSLAASPSATPDPGIAVSVEFTGTIQSLTADELTLSDGNSFKLTTDTKLPPQALSLGMTVTVSAQVEDEDFVADSITIGAPADGSSVGTPAPTDEASRTGNSDKGGKGQGNSKGGRDKGKGGKGQGNSKGDEATAEATEAAQNGDQGGKDQGGQDNGNNDNGQSPKGTPDAGCLANDKQPVATQLAQLLNVSYSEIMAWHCDGYGFGEIVRAYLLAQKSGNKLTVAGIFSLRDSGEGWAQIARSAGLSVQDIQSLGRLKAKHAKNKGH